MKMKRIKYKIGIALIILEAIVYISSMMGYGDGSGITYITSFANGDIVGGILDFVSFNLIGAIGIALALTSGGKDEKTK